MSYFQDTVSNGSFQLYGNVFIKNAIHFFDSFLEAEFTALKFTFLKI